MVGYRKILKNNFLVLPRRKSKYWNFELVFNYFGCQSITCHSGIYFCFFTPLGYF